MKTAGIRELHARSAEIFGGREPVLVTRRGHLSGIYLPLDEPHRLPLDLRRELSTVLGRYLARCLDKQGVSEQQIAEDFRAYRRRRR
ncbi:MAG: hypothetical protein ABSE73_11705 [Planctomycetota bacterium]